MELCCAGCGHVYAPQEFREVLAGRGRHSRQPARNVPGKVKEKVDGVT